MSSSSVEEVHDHTDLVPVPADTGHLWFEHPAFEHNRRGGEPRRLSATLDRRVQQVASALRHVDPVVLDTAGAIGSSAAL